MQPAEFDKLLLATLDDRQFTRGERQALVQVLLEDAPSPQQLAHYRQRAFVLARQNLGQRNGVVEWLEEVVKVLSPVEPAKAIQSNAYFSPGDDCPGRIIDLIRQARRTIDICVFTITHDMIADAIVKAHRGGVIVRIVTDEGKSFDAGSDVSSLRRSGVAVRIEKTDYHMHHKFAIFDGEKLLNGSYNWTRGAAQHNQENFIVTNDPALVKAFSRVFLQLWELYT